MIISFEPKEMMSTSLEFWRSSPDPSTNSSLVNVETEDSEFSPDPSAI
jgi:hypothetical protein